MFQDRKEAGLRLAEKLSKYSHAKDTLLLAIPRGGVEVGYYLAQKLALPLDVIIIKKLGYPGNEELAMGAVGTETVYVHEDARKSVPKEYIQKEIQRKQQQARERYALLRGKKTPPPVQGKTVIIVDDGIATGATMLMALQILKKQKARKIIVAVPVSPPTTIYKLREIADEVICLEEPDFFMAIGEFYKNFRQVEDEEAKELLEKASKK